MPLRRFRANLRDAVPLESVNVSVLLLKYKPALTWLKDKMLPRDFNAMNRKTRQSTLEDMFGAKYSDDLGDVLIRMMNAEDSPTVSWDGDALEIRDPDGTLTRVAGKNVKRVELRAHVKGQKLVVRF